MSLISLKSNFTISLILHRNQDELRNYVTNPNLGANRMQVRRE